DGRCSLGGRCRRPGESRSHRRSAREPDPRPHVRPSSHRPPPLAWAGMSTSIFGSVVLRTEDPRFLRGRGRYTDNVDVEGALHASFVRSMMAHAQVVRVEVSASAHMPGVAAVAVDPEGEADVRAGAAVVVRARIENQRVAPVPMEANAILVVPEDDGRLTVWVSTQVPFDIRNDLAEWLGLAKDRVRVIAPD